MIGTTVSHYKILEKSRPEPCSGRGCSVVRETNDENARSDESDRHSFRSLSGTALGGGGMFQNHLRTLFVSSRDFANPPKRSAGGGGE